jgi:hypothetical protein
VRTRSGIGRCYRTASNPPAILGLPAGFVFLIAAAVLTALGFIAIATSRTRAGARLAFTFLTLPATTVVVLGPAFVLIILNLST